MTVIGQQDKNNKDDKAEEEPRTLTAFLNCYTSPRLPTFYFVFQMNYKSQSKDYIGPHKPIKTLAFIQNEMVQGLGREVILYDLLC